MNRQIIFRGQLKEDKPELGLKIKDWVYGFFVYLSANNPMKTLDRNDKYYIDVPLNGDWNMSSLVRCKVYCGSVGQYSGLEDKNKTKIFENDIIIFDKDNSNVKPKVIVPVSFRNGCFEVGIHSKILLCSIADIIEVIGNTYDNPDLLPKE